MPDSAHEHSYSAINLAEEFKSLPIESIESALDIHLTSAPNKRAFLHFVEFGLLRWFASADDMAFFRDAPWRVITGRWLPMRSALLDRAELEATPDILLNIISSHHLADQVLALIPTHQDEKFMNMTEGAKFIGMTRQSFAKLRDAKAFPEYNPTSRKLQYKVSELMAYMEGKKNLKTKE